MHCQVVLSDLCRRLAISLVFMPSKENGDVILYELI